MQIGMLGLGKMGANMVRRLMAGGHDCLVFDRNPPNVAQLVAEGATGCGSLEEMVRTLAAPRIVWLMVPAGVPTESLVESLATLLEAGDTIIDGGNTFYKDDIRRARALRERGIHYVDVGTSGGVWGRERGYCLMMGGEPAVVERLDPIFRSLAPGIAAAPATPGGALPGTAAHGYLYCGPAGAGHLVKMVHNGIEYGLMQAYAEGFDLLHHAGQLEPTVGTRYEFDVAAIAELWRRGSVVGSWLLDLAAAALRDDPQLAAYTGVVPDSGEGRWTVQTAIEAEVPLPVLTEALYARFRSRSGHTFGEKLLSALRHQFGGHVETRHER